MLKPSLQLRLTQQLTMTPQLQQAIRLLQLPVMELQTQIEEALEQNVMLEVEEPAASSETAEAADVQEPTEMAEVQAVDDSDWTETQQVGPSDTPFQASDFPHITHLLW